MTYNLAHDGGYGSVTPSMPPSSAEDETMLMPEVKVEITVDDRNLVLNNSYVPHGPFSYKSPVVNTQITSTNLTVPSPVYNKKTPPYFISKIKGKKLHGQSREIISNVLEFMEREAKERTFTIPVQKAQLRTAAATGVTDRFVRKIKAELRSINAGEGTSFTTPDKVRKRKKGVTEIDDFDKCIVRRAVHEFYTIEKCVPTVEGLKRKLTESINFKGSSTSLRRILKRIGFKWKKTRNNRTILVEKYENREKRINYLRDIARYRRLGRPVVYLNESCLLPSQLVCKSGCDDNKEGHPSVTSKAQKLIILHAGGEEGFVPNAVVMWKMPASGGDEQDQINKNYYEKWITESLVPNLKQNSVVVLNNASYHNVQLEKIPNSTSRKEDMKEWLRKEDIPFGEDMLKPQLYKLIKLNKPRNIRYAVDMLLNHQGHSVLRLPVYHPDLNPIETIWSRVKQWLATKNVNFKMEDVEKFCADKFQQIGMEQLLPLCSHVKNLEKEYMMREVIMDDEIERIVANLGGTVSDSDDADDQSTEIEDDEGDVSDIEEMEVF